MKRTSMKQLDKSPLNWSGSRSLQVYVCMGHGWAPLASHFQSAPRRNLCGELLTLASNQLQQSFMAVQDLHEIWFYLVLSYLSISYYHVEEYHDHINVTCWYSPSLSLSLFLFHSFSSDVFLMPLRRWDNISNTMRTYPSDYILACLFLASFVQCVSNLRQYEPQLFVDTYPS